MSEQAEAASGLPPEMHDGAFATLWLWATFAALGVSLYGVVYDLGSVVMFHRAGCPELFVVSSWAWLLYLAAQIANKLPVSYRYTTRGTLAALDLLGFGVGLLGVGCVGLEIAFASDVARAALAATTLAWLILGFVFHIRFARDTVSLPGRVITASSFLVRSSPMFLSWFFVASA